MGSKAVLSDIDTIRSRAREHVDQGAVTDGYAADREAVIEQLNAALATELVCVLRYKHHYYMASGLKAQAVATEFAEHAEQELEHADRLAKRIVQLGGEPEFSPDGLAERSHSDYARAGSLREMIKEDLVAERIAIDSYRELALSLGHRDPTTRRLIEDILAVEEEHADDLASLLADA